jgi:hypothetical protein
VTPVYRLWSSARSTWCDYEVPEENKDLEAIRSLLPANWAGEGTQIDRDFELIPEQARRHRGPEIAVRADGLIVGHLADGAASAWQTVVRRIVASGYIPVTNGRIWVYDSWDGIGARFDLKLGNPVEALPINNPPSAPYTMVPRSSIVQVTKEAEHTDVLLKYVPKSGRGLVYVTLHEHVPVSGTAKPHVEVRIDDQRVGQLTPQMSQRFLPMITHLSNRGLVTVCWGDITGSRVAAEVRIDGVKANEASDQVLDGPPITLPRLVPEMNDPLLYDLSTMRDSLQSSTPPARETVVEPPDGSVVKFTKGRRYTYIAVRRGTRWETTASSAGGTIDQVMSWPQLAANVHAFEIAAGWRAVVEPAHELRDADNHGVFRFTVADHYLVGLCVRSDYQDEARWYTTITDEVGVQLPFGSYVEWSDIATYGQHIQAVTSWAAVI